jgi:hypothetical protein
MQRVVVFLLLVALPVRTVLAVSGLGCATIPPQIADMESDAAPCAMHGAENAALGPEGAIDDADPSCPSCALACCAALAPEATQVTAVVQTRSAVAAVIETSFANAILYALERPPRLA